jgi:hypothetical protein
MGGWPFLHFHGMSGHSREARILNGRLGVRGRKEALTHSKNLTLLPTWLTLGWPNEASMQTLQMSSFIPVHSHRRKSSPATQQFICS